jgi:CBS domain-containing protein
MTSPAIVISEQETAAAAAKLLDTERVKRLPVVDEAGRLVGIVSRGDLLRLFLREDQDILAEVRDEVLLRHCGSTPTNLGIEVDRGVVTLTGTLDRRSTLPLVVRMVGTVAGVVDVVDHLSYHYDDIRGREERPCCRRSPDDRRTTARRRDKEDTMDVYDKPVVVGLDGSPPRGARSRTAPGRPTGATSRCGWCTPAPSRSTCRPVPTSWTPSPNATPWRPGGPCSPSTS